MVRKTVLAFKERNKKNFTQENLDGNEKEILCQCKNRQDATK